MTAHVDPTGQHAIYAPSSAHRWTQCTASATAIAALGPQEEGEEAAEGTAAHDELERVMKGGAPDKEHPAAYIVALTVDYVRQLPPGQLFVEQRVRLTDEIWGRCDVGHWHPESGVLTIVDMKNGFVGVDAEDNEQLLIYAGATIKTHQLPAKYIRLVVVQPNDFRPLPRVKQWPDRAEDWPKTTTEKVHEIVERWTRIPQGPLTFVAGEHCRYCPLFGRCEPTKDLLARLSVLLQHTPEEVGREQVAIVKALQKPIEDWFKHLDKVKTKEALTKGAQPGMKIVQTTKHRAWKDETAARAAIMTAHGPNALDVPTPAQAEKLGGIDVESLSTRPDGGPALAFASDKRQTWERKSAAEMFAGVTTQTETGK